MPSDFAPPRFQQMTPAAGWRAVYSKEPNVETGQIALEEFPLICWALGVFEGDQEIVGMIAENDWVVPAWSPTFLGYIGPGEFPDKYLPLAKERAGQDSEAVELRRQMEEQIRAAEEPDDEEDEDPTPRVN